MIKNNIIKYLLICVISIMVGSTVVFAQYNEKIVQMTEEKDEAIKLAQMEIDAQRTTIQQLQVEVDSLNETLDIIEGKNEVLRVVKNNIKVYKDTTRGSEVIGMYEKGSIIEIKSMQDNWVETEHGYVSRVYLTTIDSWMEKTTLEKIESMKVSARGVKLPPKPAKLNVAATGKSGLRVEHVQLLLKGTPMYPLAQDIINIETLHNTNAFFTMAVARQETQLGKTGSGKSKNNYFGLNVRDEKPSAGYTYNSNPAICIYEFGDILERLYFNQGRTTPNNIMPKYTSDGNWANSVNSFMNQFKQEIISMY